MIAPALEEVAGDYAGKLKVGKVDVDQNNSTAFRYQVRGIPTLLLFKGGKVVDQRVGAVAKAELVKMVSPHVG
jgi:thioredoxin 1